MITLRVEISAYPAGREDLGIVNTGIEISYSRELGAIDDAWLCDHLRNGLTMYYQIAPEVAWKLLGGRNEATREFLDDLADTRIYDEGAA